ncbi:MAG: formylglycine-generating enzyme family protein [Bacteroides sp.]|nr:formylglycine-generating enzyme family protein [Bacteroides sp.]MCM1085291.1 formylglycine-generating enzyme family protein [Bacteroides sp.]
MKNYFKLALLGLLTLSLFSACDKPEKESDEIPEIEMVYVEGGEFQMGATAEQGDDAYLGEWPVRTVRLDSYYIGKYEVTQAQWKAVMGENLSYFKGDGNPVERVLWEEAQRFCEKLSAKTGKKYVLPTEAQWEYAARGGKKSKGYKYAGSNTLSEVAWYRDNSCALGEDDPDYGTHAVGTKKANELGIYDMSGNVYEWCSDWYADYDESDTDNPAGPQIGSRHVARGGSWYDAASYGRVSCRCNTIPGIRTNDRGFRVAMIP